MKQQSKTAAAILMVIGFGLMVTRCAHAAVPVRPDPRLTPGCPSAACIVSSVPLSRLCKPGYASSVRNVPPSKRGAVYREYGIESHPRGAYEVDHLVSLELGGSNDIHNLWPQSYVTKPLHGKVSLQDAQEAIRTD